MKNYKEHRDGALVELTLLGANCAEIRKKAKETPVHTGVVNTDGQIEIDG